MTTSSSYAELVLLIALCIFAEADAALLCTSSYIWVLSIRSTPAVPKPATRRPASSLPACRLHTSPLQFALHCGRSGRFPPLSCDEVLWAFQVAGHELAWDVRSMLLHVCMSACEIHTDPIRTLPRRLDSHSRCLLRVNWQVGQQNATIELRLSYWELYYLSLIHI